MAIKRCPKCGSDTIMAKVIYGATVQSLEDGTFKIIQQGKKFEVEPVQCMRCKGLFDNGMNDLVEMQPCKTCGKPSIDIDENGECDICRTMKVRPELANMSTDDLIRMVLQLEKKTSVAPAPVVTEEASVSSVETAMNPPVEETVEEEKTEITNTAAEKVAAAQQAIEQAQANEPVEETPAPKKRKVTKKSSKADETATKEESTTTEEVPVTEAPVEEPTPLNDVDPFSANTASFDMFGQPVEAPAPSVPEMPMPMFEEEQAF